MEKVLGNILTMVERSAPPAELSSEDQCRLDTVITTSVARLVAAWSQKPPEEAVSTADINFAWLLG